QCHMQVRSELAVPIKAGDEVIGVINIEHSDEYAFDEEDEHTLECLAAQASIAIQNARHYEDLKRTKGMIGARTAVAWMGLATAPWRHDININVTTIADNVQLLRADLDTGIPVDKLKQRLGGVSERVVHIWTGTK